MFYRKLFEPHLYPRAKVLPVFDKYFGRFQTRNYSQVGNISILSFIAEIFLM